MPIITLPDPSLVLLLGPSGAGKSTLARQHFKATEIISSDHVRALICDDEKEQSINRQTFELLHHLTRLRLQQRKLTVIDATNLERHARKPLLRMARAARIPAIALVFNVSPERCRLQNQQRTTRVVPDELITKQLIQLSDVGCRLEREGYAKILDLREADLDDLVIECQTCP